MQVLFFCPTTRAFSFKAKVNLKKGTRIACLGYKHASTQNFSLHLLLKF